MPRTQATRAFLLLLLTAGTTAAVVAASTPKRTATPPSPTGQATTATAPPTTTTTTTPPSPPPPPPTTTTTTSPPPPPPPQHGLTAWPAGTNGYTDVLASIPLASGRPFALARAVAAERQGLPAVGVLLSSDYPSLHTGYYVVFSGIYPSSAAAGAALGAARSHGFTDAYQARVAR
ncbi:MAG TPA: hypothetical protein VEH55_11295 [Gaiellaceae bacterium]|jgi:hypothetical protein|nr:hypothetical protein [Gaiellaceae bacterium]